MRMTLKFNFLLAVLVCCGLAPLAHAGTLSTDIISIFPKDIGEFAYADLRQARAQAWFPQLKNQLLPARFRQFEQFLSKVGINPDSQVDEIAWALVPTVDKGANAVPTGEEVVGVALGSFRPEVAEQYFKTQQLPVTKIHNFSMYAFGSATGPGDLFFFFLDSNTAAFGQRSELEKLIAARVGEAPNLLNNTELSPLVLQTNGSAAVWSVMNAAYTRLAFQQLAPEAQQFPQTQQLTAKLKDMIMQVIVKTDVQTHFQAICSSADDANTFAALLQAGLMYRKYTSGNSNPGMSALLDQTTISPAGDRLNLNITLTQAQVQSLIAQNTLSLGN
jgi:hypothetical protein